MEEEKMIPVCCNHFGIGTNNGLTFVLEFCFQEPPGSQGQQTAPKTFSRVAIDRIGLERFLILLQTTLDKTKPKGQPPAADNPRF